MADAVIEAHRFFLEFQCGAMGKEAKYIARLTDEERHVLQHLVVGPCVAREKPLQAQMLLQADVDGPHWSDGQIADAFEVGVSRLHRLRQLGGGEAGLDAVLTRQPPTRTKPRKLDGV